MVKKPIIGITEANVNKKNSYPDNALSLLPNLSKIPVCKQKLKNPNNNKIFKPIELPRPKERGFLFHRKQP